MNWCAYPLSRYRRSLMKPVAQPLRALAVRVDSGLASCARLGRLTRTLHRRSRRSNEWVLKDYVGPTGGQGLRPTGRSLRPALGDQLAQSRFIPVGIAPHLLAQMLDDQVCDQGNRANHPEPDPDLFGYHRK
jgi:hypothetical protein